MGGLCGKVSPIKSGFDLPVEKRKCTDILFLLLFIAFWIGMCGIAFIALTAGAPSDIIFAQDYGGNTCNGGVTGSLKLPGDCGAGIGSCGNFASFPWITQDLARAGVEAWMLQPPPPIGIGDPSVLSKVKFTGVCRTSCPVMDDWVCMQDLFTEDNTLYDHGLADGAPGKGDTYTDFFFGPSTNNARKVMQYNVDASSKGVDEKANTADDTYELHYICPAHAGFNDAKAGTKCTEDSENECGVDEDGDPVECDEQADKICWTGSKNVFTSCTSDAKLCQCSTQEDCPKTAFCDAGKCRACAAKIPERGFCSKDGTMTCTEDGTECSGDNNQCNMEDARKWIRGDTSAECKPKEGDEQEFVEASDANDGRGLCLSYKEAAQGALMEYTQDAKDLLNKCQSALALEAGIFAAQTPKVQERLAEIDPRCPLLINRCAKTKIDASNLLYRCIAVGKMDNVTCAVDSRGRTTWLDHQVSTSSKYTKVKSTIDDQWRYMGPDDDGVSAVILKSDERCGYCRDPAINSKGEPMHPGPAVKPLVIFGIEIGGKEGCNVAQKEGRGFETLSNNEDAVGQALGFWAGMIIEIVEDLTRLAPLILIIGGVVSGFLGTVWLILLRFFAKIFVWLIIGGIFGMSLLISLLFLHFGGVISVPMLNAVSEGMGLGLEVGGGGYAELGYLCSGVTAIIFLLILFFRKKIKLALQVIEEGTKAIADMKVLLAYPIIIFAATMVVFSYFLYILFGVMSAGEIEGFLPDNSTMDGFMADDSIGPLIAAGDDAGRRLAAAGGLAVVYAPGGAAARRLNASEAGAAAGAIGDVAMAEFKKLSTKDFLTLYHFFGLLWTNAFVQACAMLTVSSCACIWYWCPTKGGSKDLPDGPLRTSIWRTCRYHLGTAAFGSLIIAIVQFIRAIFMYIDKQTQGLQKANKMVKVLMKSIQCCMYCLEKCLKFITLNTYIITALKGSSFCFSMKEAFGLIMSNLAQVGIFQFVSMIVMLLGKLFIIAGTSVILYFSMPMYVGSGKQVNNSFAMIFINIILSYFIGTTFLSVYSTCISTILLNFCVDKKENCGSAEKPYFMSKSLANITGCKNEAGVTTEKPAGAKKGGSKKDII